MPVFSKQVCVAFEQVDGCFMLPTNSDFNAPCEFTFHNCQWTLVDMPKLMSYETLGSSV